MSDIPPRQSPVPRTHQSSPCSVASSGSSPEMERDHYREKVEHFKILVRKLQDELQSCKLRKESAETVSRLLKESKQETVNLQKRVNVQDAVIKTLQSRLESHGLSSDVFPHEGEEYIPGQSKQLLDNLTRENTRLRNIVRSKSGDPEEYAKLQQSYEDVERECNELRITISNRDTLVDELKQVLQSSDNEKDRTINELREKLNHLTHELSSRDTLCSTLAEETRLLQKQLEDVARQCQELAKRLQEKGHSTDKIVEKALKAASKDGPEGSKALIEENKVLLQKVREITDMNKRWQEYNNQREAYVKNLVSESNEMKKRLSENQGNQVTRETQVEMNQLLDEARRLSRALDEQKHVTARVTSECDRYKRELENANGQILSLRNEITELKRRKETGGIQDSNEIISALKVQIQICNEDFESERRDRERAQSKLSRLSSELERVKKENESLRREATRWQQSPRVQTAFNEPLQYFQQSGPHGNFVNEGLAARGPAQVPQRNFDKYNVIDGPDVSEPQRIEVTKHDRDRFNVTDSKNNVDDNYVSLNTSSISSKEQLSLSPTNSPRNSRDCSPNIRGSPRTASAKTGDNTLQCPKCQKEFSSDEHPELLEHMESCVY